jgi:hypothetical protein
MHRLFLTLEPLMPDCVDCVFDRGFLEEHRDCQRGKAVGEFGKRCFA